MAFARKASEIEFRHHAIESYLAAGGKLLPDDPLPDITYERNPYIGKERWIYWLKRELDPSATDWIITRDIPKLDWDEVQAIQAFGHVSGMIDRLVAEENTAARAARETRVQELKQAIRDAREQVPGAVNPDWIASLQAEIEALLATRDITARDLSPDEMQKTAVASLASFPFVAKPAWLDRGSAETPEQRQGRLAALKDWVLGLMGLKK